MDKAFCAPTQNFSLGISAARQAGSLPRLFSTLKNKPWLF